MLQLPLLTALAVLLLAAPAAHAAPQNDHISAAVTLSSGSTSSTKYDLTGATRQADEPLHTGGTGHTAWFKWTPAATGAAKISVCDSDDAVLEVYTGTSFTNLQPVKRQGVHPCKGDNAIIPAEKGVTYWVQVDYDQFAPGPTYPGAVVIDQRLQLPVTTFVDWPDVTGRSHVVRFHDTYKDIHKYECVLDGVTKSCVDGEEIGHLKPLSGGTHFFSVRATDSYGNTEAKPAVKKWTVDATGAVPTITTSSPYRSSTPTFEFTSEPGAKFTCTDDSGAHWNPCSSPHTLSARPDGYYSFAVRAYDTWGNAEMRSQAFQVDTRPLAITPVETPPGTPAVPRLQPVAPHVPVVGTSPQPCRLGVHLPTRTTRAALAHTGLPVRMTATAKCAVLVRVLIGKTKLVDVRRTLLPGKTSIARVVIKRRRAGNLTVLVTATGPDHRQTTTTRTVRMK